MTGTIVGLAGNAKTGTIRCRDGSRFAFSAAAVLGDFDVLTVGHMVSFDPDRAQLHPTAVRVFREPSGPQMTAKQLSDSPDLRYTGFRQMASVRGYFFDAVVGGRPIGHFIVTVDLALLMKHHIGVQEAPALCLHKLAADLKALPGSGHHELDDGDLLACASARAASGQRKRARHPFAGRRGSPQPGSSGFVRPRSVPE
jgi:hypothetical protein